MERFALVIFNRKSGKIIKTATALGKGLLKMAALNGTTKTRDALVFSIDTGIVEAYYEGTGDFPNISTEHRHIDDYCKGLLEAVREEA